ncbi:MAG: 4Fe-4S dicluster domain-containing protein [Chlorobi bacterium]|nr:4Fe-4S dicluster domain-containing protein [Chlorobiota bacterium]
MAKEIVIISGKGGTGKTSITASFAVLEKDKAVIADCDVDAADMHLLMKPDFAKSEDFYSGELAVINQEACIKCGKCADVCRFDAIPFTDSKYVVDDLSCEGCGYCARVCPTDAITNISQNVGEWYISDIKTGSKMVHAKLAIGADNSGKLVAQVKNEAKRIAEEGSYDFIIVDGSPGVGCPVVSSLSGANYVVLVTEPTVSGLHDLKRVYELVHKFNLKAGCIINKYDLNEDMTSKIKDFLEKENINHLADVPYRKEFIEAITNGQTIVEYDKGELKEIITNTWNKLKNIIN